MIKSKLTFSLLLLAAGTFILSCRFGIKDREDKKQKAVVIKSDSLASKEIWQIPDTSTIPHDEFGKLVRYGRDLIVNTAYYIGPEGKVSKNLGNKMNCGSCHLEAGTKPYALSYFSSHARYPQYRAREDKILSLADRVNNCIERPHNGRPLKLDSREMTAIVCYMKWLAQDVPVDQHVEGDAPLKIELLDRAADPIKGEVVYKRECVTCHGADGQGKLKLDGSSYEYPPLWGSQSFQPGSSMHRVVKAAAFIYANMPNKVAAYDNPKLTVEEAFDVAAFVNDDRIHKRPRNNGVYNYANHRNKPLDHGEGPFVDSFPAEQHKFGPWKPIIEYHKKHNLPTKF